MIAYVVGALPAGVAGAIFAYSYSYVSATSFSFDLAIGLLAASILGGATSIYGVFLGAALLQIVPTSSTVFSRYSLIVYGLFLIVGGLLLGGNVANVGQRIVRRFGIPVAGEPRRGRAVLKQETAADYQTDSAGGLLRVDGVTKSFGGLTALDGVSFEARAGQVTALIGPNGSGKTTMLNLICGYYAPTSGDIWLDQVRLNGLRPHQTARHGVARTFQTPIIPRDLCAWQVVMSGLIGRVRVSLAEIIVRAGRYLGVRRLDETRSMTLLGELALDQHADTLASELPLGTRRMLELGRAVVHGNRLVVLDEIASGLDTDDIRELTDQIRQLREHGATIVLVEHNFALVRNLADKVVVLADGRLIAEGTSAEIEQHADVIEQYLGSGAGLSGTTLERSRDEAVHQ
jgi:branched-chain amino acid transport system permease protein